jgi:hypothetical protein
MPLGCCGNGGRGIVCAGGCTCTTPLRDVGGTGWVGSLATGILWEFSASNPARPSDIPAVESVLVVLGVVVRGVDCCCGVEGAEDSC